MSDTLRTDEEVLLDGAGNMIEPQAVLASFSRDLERELNDRNREIAQFQTLWDLLPEIENHYRERLVYHLRYKIEAMQKEIAGLHHKVSELESRVNKARLLIENFGTVASDSSEVLRSAEKWLKGES